MSELVNIQKWLTSILVRPGALADKIRMADETYKLDSRLVIRSSARMSSGQKISIYARGYVLRLMECMSTEFAAVKYLLGEELFGTFAKAYLFQLPPSSPDLYDLGRNFAAFLKASQPQSNSDSSMFDLPVELAILERAIAEVSRIKGLEGQESTNVVENQLFYLFGTASFQTSPCLVLLQSQFLLAGFVKAVQRGEDATIPDKENSFIAVSRRNYAINIHELQAWQWQFLQSLQSTNNYMAAIEQTAQTCSIPKDTLMADSMLWIPVAVNFGYLFDETDVN